LPRPPATRITPSDFQETLMKTNIISGSTIAVAAVALVSAGAAPAAAKHSSSP